VEAGNAPDLEGTETPFKFGYATITVAGAQRVTGPIMRHFDLLKYLISRGLPVDVPDIVGFTALAHAVMNQFPQLNLARVLLEAGADVNYQNRYGEVALFGAFQHNNTTAIDLLCEFRANLEIKEADGLSPMTFYLRCGPQVTATIRKWINKRSGEKAPRVEKRCDNCGNDDLSLKNCSKCQVARYCSVGCQRTLSSFLLFFSRCDTLYS
jgi:MYND finger/Ankyrin repeats (many copies)